MKYISLSATIKPIHLPGLDAINITFAGEVATVSGWGRTGNSKILRNIQ